MPVQTVGVSSDHMPVSETITASAASRSACSLAAGRAKCGEPDSSSPSISSLRLTAGAVRPVAARCARTPRVWKNTWPLSSAAPRAYSRPSRDHRLERVGVPAVLAGGGLHVVVAVDQHGRARPASPEGHSA